MSLPPSKQKRSVDEVLEAPNEKDYLDGIDITQEVIVGRVTFDGLSNTSVYEAAFNVIAQQGDGRFAFPSEKGGTVRVTVSTESPV